MNYFEFFDIEEAFIIDEKELRARYLENSRRFHPDFHSLSDEETRDAVLEQSTINNNAFAALRHLPGRIEHILQNHGLLQEGEHADMPMDFLMEMMEINEALAEVEMGDSAEGLEQLMDQVKSMEEALLQEVKPHLTAYVKNGEKSSEQLVAVKDYYLKNKYLLRIKEKIDTFASPE